MKSKYKTPSISFWWYKRRLVYYLKFLDVFYLKKQGYLVAYQLFNGLILIFFELKQQSIKYTIINCFKLKRKNLLDK